MKNVFLASMLSNFVTALNMSGKKNQEVNPGGNLCVRSLWQFQLFIFFYYYQQIRKCKQSPNAISLKV